ncbi:iron-siderophore ABC transporter substrate-binding protein [Patulibacter defluvii]|uniref:iron-siderophore ABC transporter substrate-binding protein n=1 Tax=Patulibacter defluvii TaxID=3095358 RepID=UPI002A76627E|nr:iron-siderophore ABC transporter substrate-binding protein [Patulibacter sp. DM4]
MRRLFALLVTLAATLALAPAANAAATRVVALEWDAVEGLSALGVTPVGIADARGYDAFVRAPRLKGGEDVGLRQAPSLEKIRALRPDLIVVPDYRSTSNLAELRKIATVLVTTPYPAGGGNGAQFQAMVNDFRRIAAAVGKSGEGETVLRRMKQRFAAQKKALRKKRRHGAGVVIAEPGGTTSAPALRLMTNNSLAAEVVRRIGLRNAWGGRNTRFGFTTSGIGALAKVKSSQWLAFVYLEQYRTQIQKFRELPAFAKLPVVRARHYRNLADKLWLYGGPISTTQIADEVSRAIRRG